MCPQNVKRRISNRNYYNNDDDLHRLKFSRYDDDFIYRKTQPRYNKAEHQDNRKISRNNYHYSNKEEERSSKRVRFTDSNTEQEKHYAKFHSCNKNQQRLREIRHTMPSVNGKGNWDIACALAFLHLFGDFMSQNEATESSSSSPSSSSSSSKSSVNSLPYNRKHEDDDGVNFVLYHLTRTISPAECLQKESVNHLPVPDVVNPTQAAHHWLSASRGITYLQ